MALPHPSSCPARPAGEVTLTTPADTAFRPPAVPSADWSVTFDPARGLLAYNSADYQRFLLEYSDDRVRYYSDAESYQLLCQYRLLAAQRWQGFDERGVPTDPLQNTARTRGRPAQPLHYYEHYQPWQQYTPAALAAHHAFYRTTDLAAVFAYHCAFYPLDPSFAVLVRTEPRAQRAVLATNANRPFCWDGTCNAQSFVPDLLQGVALATLVEEPARFLSPDIGLPARLTLTPLAEDGTPTASDNTLRMGLLINERASRSVLQPRRPTPPTRAQLNRGDRTPTPAIPDYGLREPPAPATYPPPATPRTAPPTDPLDAPADDGVGTGSADIAQFLETLYTAARELLLEPRTHNSIALTLAVYGPHAPWPAAARALLTYWQTRPPPADDSTVSHLLRDTAPSSPARYHAIRALGQRDPAALDDYLTRHAITALDPLTLSRQLPDLTVALTILGSGLDVLPTFFAEVLPREEVATLTRPADGETDDAAGEEEEGREGEEGEDGEDGRWKEGEEDKDTDGEDARARILPRIAPWTGPVYRDALAFRGDDEDARLEPYDDVSAHVNEDAVLLDAGVFTDNPFDMEVAAPDEADFHAATTAFYGLATGEYRYHEHVLSRTELLDALLLDVPPFSREELRQLRWLAEDQGDGELMDAVTELLG